ncbi:MAG: phage holin family protein [Bacteroidota bacterium]
MEKLKDIIFKFLRLDGIFSHLSGYLEARIELLKMEIREDLAKVLAKAMIFGIIFFFGFMFMIFLSIGLAHFLNQYFSESYIGFWIVAGLYLAVFLIFMIFQKNILHNLEKHLSELIKRKENK